jgi:TfoX/Sxy family transcriptional regulator of competence genes
MAYDEALATRIRTVLGPRPDVTEKKMFGGLAFLLSQKMLVGIIDSELMVRVGPERYAAALMTPHARVMDFARRPMKGYVFVAAQGVKTVKGLKPWVEQALAFVATVEKPKKKRSSKPRRFIRSVR